MRVIVTEESIFKFPENETQALVITTNGVTNKNGYAVMGKGIAKAANDAFKCSKRLGEILKLHGNHCTDLGAYSYGDRRMRVLTFPTKTHWRFPSQPGLIEQSAIELLRLCNDLDLDKVYMPPAGCGCGGLRWNTQVMPILSRWLDDRFVVILNPGQYNI